MNSRRKGAVGEREASKELARVLRCEARRGQQFSGSKDSPDVVCSLPKTHIEVKRVQAFNLYKALNQAIGDAGENVPVVLHRRNNAPWVAIVRLDDLPQLATNIYLHLSSENANG